jgi:hypothetical protein
MQEYQFKNGRASIEHRVSPNGTPEVVIHLSPDGLPSGLTKIGELYKEVSAWVKTEQNVEHTVLLMKHTDTPYIVAFQSRGYDE